MENPGTHAWITHQSHGNGPMHVKSTVTRVGTVAAYPHPQVAEMTTWYTLLCACA